MLVRSNRNNIIINILNLILAWHITFEVEIGIHLEAKKQYNICFLSSYL
jgi:hypothetical protein